MNRIEFLLLWIIANTLCLGLSLYFCGWAEKVDFPEFYHFDISNRPGLFTTIVTGLSLGLTQWKLLKNRFGVSILWIFGAAIGFWIMTVVGAFLHFLAIFEFRRSLTEEESFLRVAHAAMTAGAIGGVTSGFLQGWSLQTRFIWAIVNAFGWALGWTAGRVLNYKTSNAAWYLPGFSVYAKIAVQMGALGLVAGFVSSAITGFPLLKLLEQREQRRW